MNQKKVLFILFTTVFLILSFNISSAKDIRIITPYLGSIRNVYESEEHGLDLNDSSLLKGLYFQWINPERFQWNVFIYQSSDINYSTLWGGHFIFDYYFGKRSRGKYVVGTGIEFIGLDMDAGNNIAGPLDFKLLNNIIIPYIRAGRYFLLGPDTITVTLLPWIGVQPEFVRGKISFNFGGPPKRKDIEDDALYALAGLNAKTVIMHFFEVEVKYKATFNRDDYFSTLSAMTNLYLSRHWGISYRFKFMETSSGSDTYHIGGVAFLF